MTKEAKKRESNDKLTSPVKPGSTLHQILTLVARKVADELRTKKSAESDSKSRD